MKVLMLSWEFPPQVVGGLGRHVFELSRCLSRCGIEPHVVTPRVVGKPMFEKEDEVYVYRVGPPVDSKHFKAWALTFNRDAVRDIIRIQQYVGGLAVVHAHDWIVAYAARTVSRIFDLPLVSTIHATEHGRNRGLHNRMQKEIHDIEENLVKASQAVICCSRYMKDEVARLFSVDAGRITVIPNGVSFSSKTKGWYRGLNIPGISEDDRLVFFIGRLVAEKGVSTLIKAFSLVAKEKREVKLVVGGKGPQERELKELASQLGLGDRVVFTGFLSDRQRDALYHWAEVAVFPSWYEPFGIVALEAMAAGTPVVVSDVGGLGEIVEDGVTGLKVPPMEVEALGQAILKILEDQELAQNLRRNAYRCLENEYNWERVAQATAELYMTISQREGRKGAG